MENLASDRPQTPLFSGKIANLPDSDKPREKAIQQGIRALSDAELLAIIIGTGIPGKSVIDMSHEILAECNNNLNMLASMTIPEISRRFKGVGPAKAVSIAAALQLASRFRDCADQRKQVVSSKDAYLYMRRFVQHLPTEEFWILILSRANTILRAECISRGGTSATYVEPKLVVKRALDYLAAGIILVHNHPSGNRRPSPDDDRLTKKIKDAAALLDIAVLDHIIITPSDHFSYRDEGRL